jgi:hypothetical protein
MPFDLTFEEPPYIGARRVLSTKRRLILRRAIGDELLERAAALREPITGDEREDSGDLIRLHPSGLVEDLKHDWLATPITELFGAITEVASIDLSDDAAAGHDLCELGSRQLHYFGPYQASDPIWSRNFFNLGLRIGRSAYPLLAHRAAYLAWQLVQGALAVDEVETLAAIHGLLDDESLWMIDSQEDYFEALDRYRAGDKAAIVEAYGDLAEGTFRRYGSLVVALERIVASEAVQTPLVLKDIGELEDQLGVWQTELLPALTLRSLERNLRNAGAHANVIV